MNTFSYATSIPTAQRKPLGIFVALMAVAMLILTGVASGFFPNEESMGAMAALIVFSLCLCYSVRYGFLQGWKLALQAGGFVEAVVLAKPAIRGARAFGLIWRAVVAIMLGNWLAQMAADVESEGLMLAAGLLVMATAVTLALLFGLRFGYLQASEQAAKPEGLTSNV